MGKLYGLEMVSQKNNESLLKNLLQQFKDPDLFQLSMKAKKIRNSGRVLETRRVIVMFHISQRKTGNLVSSSVLELEITSKLNQSMIVVNLILNKVALLLWILLQKYMYGLVSKLLKRLKRKLWKLPQNMYELLLMVVYPTLQFILFHLDKNLKSSPLNSSIGKIRNNVWHSNLSLLLIY